MARAPQGCRRSAPKQGTMRRSPPSSTGSPAESAPTDLRIASMTFQGESYVVVSRPIERSAIQLTDAEREVAKLVAAGFTNEAIAQARGTSTRTIANQVASLLRKLGVPSRHHVGRHLGLL